MERASVKLFPVDKRDSEDYCKSLRTTWNWVQPYIVMDGWPIMALQLLGTPIRVEHKTAFKAIYADS